MSRTQSKKTRYMNQTFGFQDPCLHRILQATEEERVLPMQTSPYEGRILYILARMAQVRKAVEIGTLHGHSTFHLARALPEGGMIWTCDRDRERQERARDLLKGVKESEKIRWVCGPAQETLRTLESQGPFDLVFIDADKEAYGEYLHWAENHLRSGGLLLADNTFLFGAVYGEERRSVSLKTREVMERFNVHLSDSRKWTGAMIPTEEGLTVAVRK